MNKKQKRKPATKARKTALEQRTKPPGKLMTMTKDEKWAQFKARIIAGVFRKGQP